MNNRQTDTGIDISLRCKTARKGGLRNETKNLQND